MLRCRVVGPLLRVRPQKAHKAQKNFMSSDTKAVRSSEQLDWAALDAYVRPRLGVDANAQMTIEQFPGGHSNLTYLLRFGKQEFVYVAADDVYLCPAGEQLI